MEQRIVLQGPRLLGCKLPPPHQSALPTPPPAGREPPRRPTVTDHTAAVSDRNYDHLLRQCWNPTWQERAASPAACRRAGRDPAGGTSARQGLTQKRYDPNLEGVRGWPPVPSRIQYVFKCGKLQIARIGQPSRASVIPSAFNPSGAPADGASVQIRSASSCGALPVASARRSKAMGTAG